MKTMRSIVALSVGVLVDRVGDIVTVPMLVLIISISGSSFDPLTDRGQLIAVLVAATLSSFFAGWVAGRIAVRRPALHGLLVGVLSIILSWITLPHSKWSWIDTGNVIVTPLATMAGGLLAARRVHSRLGEPAA